jgi:3-oxoacyl-[acyl-carrier protein] reductase
MQIDLSREVALVTGSSRGIGRAIALALGRAGAQVAVHYREAEAEAAAVCRAIPGAVAIRGDLEEEDDVRSLHLQVSKAFGPITLLVNNAGIWEDNPIGNPGSWEKYRRLMRINLDAHYLLCDLVVPAMKAAKRGAIVNISSRAGKRGEPQAAHYAMSKGALNAMTVSLARELAPHIRVNAVAPGWIETPMTAEHLADEGTKKMVLGQTLLGRVGTPDDIANAVLFLASAPYVTGQILHVNGGSYLNS